MEYRTFGRTRARVSAVGFGGGPAGVPNYLMAWDSSAAEAQAQVERAVRRALERGITYFDTAPGYGDGISETLIGRALGADRSKIFLASKSPDADWSPAGIRAALEVSLRLLRTDYLDLLQFHGDWINEAGVKQILDEGGLDTYEQLRQEGKIRYLGFSSEGPNGPVERLIRSGRFDTMLINFNLLYQTAGAFRDDLNPPETTLSLARAQKMGTATMRTLTSSIFLCWVKQIAPGVADQVDWSGALLAYNLSHPQIDVAVVGMGSAEEVDRNADLVESGKYRVDMPKLHGEFVTRA